MRGRSGTKVLLVSTRGVPHTNPELTCDKQQRQGAAGQLAGVWLILLIQAASHLGKQATSLAAPASCRHLCARFWRTLSCRHVGGRCCRCQLIRWQAAAGQQRAQRGERSKPSRCLHPPRPPGERGRQHSRHELLPYACLRPRCCLAVVLQQCCEQVKHLQPEARVSVVVGRNLLQCRQGCWPQLQQHVAAAQAEQRGCGAPVWVRMHPLGMALQGRRMKGTSGGALCRVLGT